jgi:hypothetical protein
MKIKKQAEGLVSLGASLEGFEKLYGAAEVEKRDAPQLVWAEPQLFLLPFCVPQDADRHRSIKIVETVRLNDQLQERVFKVNPDPEWGLPGPFELEVMAIIYQIAAEHMDVAGSVPQQLELGSLRSFLKRMGRPMTGKYAAILKDALKRLAATNCVSEGFFYSKPRDVYVIKSFQFITSAQIVGELNFNGGRIEKTIVEFHPFILENLNSNFRTLIDFEYLRSLKKDIAKSLVMHLSYRFFKSRTSVWEADYDWIANRLGLVFQENTKRAKEQLKPALQELQATGFLDSWEWKANRRIRFNAGPTYVRQHERRVANRDAWLLHQERESKRIDQVPRTAKEAEKISVYDPLASLCTEYALNGWSSVVAQKARVKGIDKANLQKEAVSRGHICRNA